METVLTARDLTRHYEVSRGLFKGHAQVRALNGVSFELEAGKTLAVVGESGCGKSTLARALTLIEEPTSGSLKIAGQEVKIQAQVLNLFMDLQQQFRTAYVFISHNLAVVRHVADDVLVMYLGRPAEMGPADKLYENPLHPYTRALLSATPAIHPDPTKPKIRIQGELPNPLHPPEDCAFHKRCPYATERCRSEVPELRLLDQRQVACHHAEQFLG